MLKVLRTADKRDVYEGRRKKTNYVTRTYVTEGNSGFFFLCKSLLFLLSKTANDEIASLEAGAGEKGIGNERRLVSVKNTL